MVSLPPVPPPSGTSLSDANFQETFRIDRVFLLLIQIIQVLQSVAIVQAQRLQFLTTWQQAYTALMNQIPVFTASGSLFGGTDTEDANTRDDMNRINSTYTEQLRSERSQLSDAAKSLEANLTQTNDAVTQQANMATALLQQLSTIVSTIYK